MKRQLSRRNRGNGIGASGVDSMVLEPMEARRMLSAAVAHRVLLIEGTPRSDTIVLTMDSPRTLRVRVGGTEFTFLKKRFGKIRIVTGRGDDLVTVGSDTNPITLPVRVSGGDGGDTIIGGAGDDLLEGGAGADQITGAAGDDSVSGDNGNDDLHGGDGRDLIRGGRGDDQLHDDAGFDSVFGNAGADLFYHHDKVKQIRDSGAQEESFTEPMIQVSPMARRELTINQCPLYARDGTKIPGGLVVAGGSTLVMSGKVLNGWTGEGLAVSNAYVPHFDLPGVGIVSGDANLEGGVDFRDLVKLAQGYDIGSTPIDWWGGDFDYDGNIDFNDLVKLAQNYNTDQTPSQAP